MVRLLVFVKVLLEQVRQPVPSVEYPMNFHIDLYLEVLQDALRNSLEYVDDVLQPLTSLMHTSTSNIHAGIFDQLITILSRDVAV